MSISVDLSHGAFRVEFVGVGGEFSGGRAAEWVRDFVGGVAGDPQLVERVSHVHGTGVIGGDAGVSGSSTGAAGYVGQVEFSVQGNTGGKTGFDARRGASAAESSGEFSWRSNSAGVTATSAMPRGPNYLRNQATRMKKRIKKQESASVAEKPAVGFFSECDPVVQTKLRESRAKLLVLENQRKILEEERKIKKLQSPIQVLEDAMRMVKMAEDAAKRSADSKVAGWAATISESYAESIARSAPSSVPSLDSMSSGGSKRVVAARAKAATKQASKFTIAEMPLSKLEAKLESLNVMSVTQIVEARKKAGRQLHIRDFESPACPVRLGPLDKVEVYAAAGIDLFN